MNSFRYDYAVIGGDMRQVYLTQLLAEENKTVCCSALCTTDTSGSAASVPLETALGSSAHIIGPIPLSKDGGFFHQSGLKKKHPLKTAFHPFKTGTTIFCRMHSGRYPARSFGERRMRF